MEQELYYSYIYRALFNGKVCRWNKYLINVYINTSWIGPYLDKNKVIEKIQSAFTKWETALKKKIKFYYVENSNNCDIYIDFQRNNFNGTIGQCQFTKINDKGEFKKMYITLGLITSQYFEQNAVHEIGHAIGIAGHSPHNLDIMYSSLTPSLCGNLSIKDINTIKLIYDLPVGCDLEYIKQNINKILNKTYENTIEFPSSINETNNAIENELITNNENRNIPQETYKLGIINLVKITQNQDFIEEVNIKNFIKHFQLQQSYQ